MSTPFKVPGNFAKRHGVVFAPPNVIAYREDACPNILLECQRVLKSPIQFKKYQKNAFEALLTKQYAPQKSVQNYIAEIGEKENLHTLGARLAERQDLLEDPNDAPIIKLINAILTEAIVKSASDLHIETFENTLTVRLRIDGILQNILTTDKAIAPKLVSRVKVMAKLDIAEKRLPQDGRMRLNLGDKPIDVRVSVLPAKHGERVVLRLLEPKAELPLDALGLSLNAKNDLQALLSHPHGILLATGPTGSGKTTSLYAMLNYLNDGSRNILTVEDPIEYDLDGIGQTQIQPKIDLTFAKGLRAILRQDPDVVMVGEIRDKETAEIAIQASLTGHLVLSTLHTNSALGAIERLTQLGIPAFLLASSLLGVMSQRLVRQLCPDCKTLEPASRARDSQPLAYQPKGCPHCHQQGYQGRTGIYELIKIDRNLASLIANEASKASLENAAHQTYPSLSSALADKIQQGVTSREEGYRVSANVMN